MVCGNVVCNHMVWADNLYLFASTEYQSRFLAQLVTDLLAEEELY